MKLLQKKLLSLLLLVSMSTLVHADCSYELFTISSTKNTKIVDFIEQLSDECSFSIIINDPTAEKFLNRRLNKTHLKNLTIDEVLNIILHENNLSYTLENGILKIAYLTTKVFSIDYILSQRKSSGNTDITLSSSSSSGGGSAEGGGAEEGASSGSGGSNNSETGIKIQSTDEVLFWQELDAEFQRVLNRPHDSYVSEKPIINKNAGLVTVTSTIKQLERFDSYLQRLQNKVQLQVLIDVQLLSVTMNSGNTTGIDWKQLYALQNLSGGINYNGSASALPSASNLASGVNYNGSSSLVNINTQVELNEVLKFLRTQGDVTSISNPKVLTLNNQPALITAGTEYFYKIQSQTNQQAAGGGVAGNTQSDTIESVFAGVLLTITPEIADDKTITLKINPSLSETTTDISQTPNTGRTMPPDLSRRQLSSVVTVKDGNKIILGGLISTKTTSQVDKVPLLGDIPIIEYMFKYEKTVKTTEELVIIIQPRIIKKDYNSLSLSDLGYKGITNDHLKKSTEKKD